jgi:hypothetical protein
MTAPALLPSWTPRDGETVHLRAGNGFGLPAGRYCLGETASGNWRLLGVSAPARYCTTRGRLILQEGETILTPISDAELERERHEVQLRAAAPLRQRRTGAWRAQHDASDLALFRAANEPGLGL